MHVSDPRVVPKDVYREVYVVLRDALGENADPVDAVRAMGMERGISDDVVISLHRQLGQRMLKEDGKAIRADRRTPARRWAAGATLMELARESKFPPYAYARCVLEGIAKVEEFEKPRETALGWLKAPDTAPGRIRKELLECARTCTLASPPLEEAKHVVGAAFERYLESWLRSAGIPFESEDASRLVGRARTPDALLKVPIGILLEGESEPRIVNWIDSKAMFGDTHVHEDEHGGQFEAYVNRFGPGMVVYWGGMVEGVWECGSASKAIAAVTRLPPAFVLPGDEKVRYAPSTHTEAGSGEGGGGDEEVVEFPNVAAIVQQCVETWWDGKESGE